MRIAQTIRLQFDIEQAMVVPLDMIESDPDDSVQVPVMEVIPAVIENAPPQLNVMTSISVVSLSTQEPSDAAVNVTVSLSDPPSASLSAVMHVNVPHVGQPLPPPLEDPALLEPVGSSPPVEVCGDAFD
jgi:hypothetical protein